MQKTGKSGVQYVSVLQMLAKACNFSDQEDTIICDQLITGMLPDKKLKAEMYEVNDLTLKKAIKIMTTLDDDQRGKHR